jgi:hypothetical protein
MQSRRTVHPTINLDLNGPKSNLHGDHLLKASASTPSPVRGDRSLSMA